MNLRVEPIRSRDMLERLERALMYESYRYYMIWKFSTNSALRASDVLKVKVEMVRHRSNPIKEKKTRKYRQLYINDEFRADIDDWSKYLNDDDFLFRDMKSNRQPSFHSYFGALKRAAERIGLNQNIGTHSARKTFGYWHYKKFNDIAQLQYILNHSHPKETLIYIGVIDEEVNITLDKFYI
jgi:integrase